MKKSSMGVLSRSMIIENKLAACCTVMLEVYMKSVGQTERMDYQDPCPESHQRLIERIEHCLRGATAEQLHQTWINLMVIDGWQYGARRCKDMKTDPYMVPYHQLPMIRVVMDQLIKAQVLELAQREICS